jgi:hypothetical protein
MFRMLRPFPRSIYWVIIVLGIAVCVLLTTNSPLLASECHLPPLAVAGDTYCTWYNQTHQAQAGTSCQPRLVPHIQPGCIYVDHSPTIPVTAEDMREFQAWLKAQQK